jgi:type II secretory pathway component PulF
MTTLYLKIAAAAAIALALFAAGWKVGTDRLEASMNKERLELTQAAEQATRQTEQNWNMKYQNATRNHDEVQKLLTNQLALLRRDADGLRSAVASLKRQLSKATPAACVRAGEAALDVFGACASEYINVASNLG